MKIHSMLSRSMTALGVFVGVLAHQPLYSTWSPPVTLNRPDIPVIFQSGPVLVVVPSGNAISTWTDSGSPEFPGVRAISSSFFTPGVGWTPAQFISNISANQFGNALYTGQGDSDIVMNASNYAVAAWEGVYNADTFPNVIVYAIRSSDGTWSPAQNLTTGGNDVQPINVNLAMNDAGTTIAAWRVLDTSNGTEVTQTSFLPFGGSWSIPLTISIVETAIGGENKPFPAMNQKGDVVVTWLTRTSNIYGTAVATYNAATNTWSSPLTLDSAATSNVSENPRAAIDENGHAVVTWSINTTVYASYFDGTSWSAPVDLSSVLGAGTFSTDPDVVMDFQGTATVVWSSFGATQLVYSTTRLPDGTWSVPVAISNAGNVNFFAFMSQNPLSAAANGDMMVIWSDDDNIFESFEPFGGSWSAPELIAAFDFSPSYLNIGVTSCGLGIAVWQVNQVIDGTPVPTVMASVNANMLLPQNVRGKKCCDKFTIQKRCLNLLKWDASPCAQFYNIYRDGVLIASISPSKAAEFVDPLSCKGKNHSYTIALVNSSGVESEQIPVVFR